MSWLRVFQYRFNSRFGQYLDAFSRLKTGMPSRHRSEITPHLFLGGQYDNRGISKLKKWGITAIVNMRSDPPDASLAHNAFHYLHLPTPDRQAPTMDQLKQGVEFIKQEVEANGKVYIHCLFGQGRGPTMVMAYLITNGMKVKEALAKIQAIRPFAAPSPEQMKRLKRYRKSLKKGA